MRYYSSSVTTLPPRKIEDLQMRRTLCLWALLALLGRSRADSLPYNPTTILLPPNSSYAYVFQPSPRSPNQVSLRAIEVGQSFASSGLSSSTLFDSLPFAKDVAQVPYTPMLGAAGNITVITGNCSEGANATSIWRFSPDRKSAHGNGTWMEETISTSNSSLVGTNYLSNGVSFSSEAASNASTTDFYVFGGMCPSANSTSDSWMGAANYSNTMLAITVKDDDYKYEMASVAGGGQPIAEAGFSMTGLTPSYSQSDSNIPSAQHQQFLMLGGHTGGAFLNVSQVALFALPQRSWAFFPIQQPYTVSTNFATRQTTTNVEPRSGHTAVLSEDGSRVIVFGGWVGDVSNPAQPQLAVLHLGPGYGGDEQAAWSWSIPSQSGSGLAVGTGLYGHGATMLPGGVMMVMGGYSIGASSPTRAKRASQMANDAVFLYNVTSGAWISAYESPYAKANSSSNSGLSQNVQSISRQTKLGVGIAFGVLGLVGMILLGYWIAAARRRKQEQREQEVMSHPRNHSTNHSYDQGGSEKRSINGCSEGNQAESPFFHDRERVASGEHRPLPSMDFAGSSGLFIDVPSPTQGLRKGLANRPYMYHAAPRQEDLHLGRGRAGIIHPIEEQDDEDDHSSVHRHTIVSDPHEEDVDGVDTHIALLQQEHDRLPHQEDAGIVIANPFLDPNPHPNPLRSNPLTPLQENFARSLSLTSSRTGSPQRRPTTADTQTSENWTSYGEDEPLGVSQAGRRSPTKSDDRTSSTLSDRSHDSTISITRTMSTRTGALLAAAFAGRRETRDLRDGTSLPKLEAKDIVSVAGAMPRFYVRDSDRIAQSYVPRDCRLHPAIHPALEKSTESFMTARSHLPQTQTEGEDLLCRGPSFTAATVVDRDDPYQRAIVAQRRPSSASAVLLQAAGLPGDNRHRTELSISASQHRRQGWVGSLRRALTAISNSDRTFSMTSVAGSQSEERAHIMSPPSRSSTMSRPSKVVTSRKTGLVRNDGGNNAPRRTVSDGSTPVTKQKRGRKDWDDKQELYFDLGYRGHEDPGDWGEPRTSSEQRQAEEEWDVESAVEKRDVQVMFTVPKTRLRVVNADMERASLRSTSDGAASRSESVRQLGRRNSELRLRKQQSYEANTFGRNVDQTDERWSAWREDMESEVTTFGGLHADRQGVNSPPVLKKVV